ncbi:hypothetical protein [Saccharopolyspora spinosa]|uniref:hypothetical protein n=1 Tax=Saccharopolyspora spinosa TaxID=60894 RepID=UPI00023798CC|nr:hypothetical protein [Saccharopolyspora spinosa]
MYPFHWLPAAGQRHASLDERPLGASIYPAETEVETLLPPEGEGRGREPGVVVGYVPGLQRGANVPRRGPDAAGGECAMSAEHAHIGRMIRAAVVMLGYAADDVERGRWSDAEIRRLGDQLATVAAALRSAGTPPKPLVIDLSEAKP